VLKDFAEPDIDERDTHTYFYEILNKRGEEGEPKYNFSFLGKVKKGSDDYCWIANGHVLKKFKVTNDEQI